MDTDLATLRKTLPKRPERHRVERGIEYVYGDWRADSIDGAHDALARVEARFREAEAELSRLREQRDDERREREYVIGLAGRARDRYQAAEARLGEAHRECARLQQEADRQLARHLCYTSALSRERFWRAVDEALAGPDTPADCEHDYVFEQGSLSLYRCDKCGQESYDGVFPRVGNYPLPADSQEDKT